MSSEEEEEEEGKNEFEERYSKPGDPVAFSGRNAVSRNFPGRPRKALVDQMRYVDSYTIFRSARPVKTNPYMLYKKRTLLECDLIEVQQLAEFNDGTRYIFSAIDCFTRKAWLRPLENKEGKNVSEKWLDVLNSMGPLPTKMTLHLDSGNEFKSKHFLKVCKDHNITLKWAMPHGFFIERFNQSIKSLLYHYLEHFETKRYIDELPNLLETYNSRYHRSIKMSPLQAEEPARRDEVIRHSRNKYEKRFRERKAPSFAINDIVRIYKDRGIHGRSYETKFTREAFVVVKVFSHLARPFYTLKDWNSGEELAGKFYEEELSLLHGDHKWALRETGRSRTRRGVREKEVTWRDFPAWAPTWVKADTVVDI